MNVVDILEELNLESRIKDQESSEVKAGSEEEQKNFGPYGKWASTCG